LIVGKERSLITNLAAANCYTYEHFTSDEISGYMKEATFFYSTGYFLTVSPESMMVMAKYAGNFFKFKIKKQVQINHS
jgi:adenosine kinase